MSATDHGVKRTRRPTTEKPVATVKKEIETDHGPQEEKKSGSHINVKVKNGDVDDHIFKIGRNMELSKLMTAYSDRVSLDFLFNGKRLQGEQTPDKLEMEDGDEIEAILVWREKPDPNLINVKVKSLVGNVVLFRIERTKKLGKLMRDYCEGRGLEYQTQIFTFDGRRLREEQTPEELGMEDGDVIYSIHYLVGS